MFNTFPNTATIKGATAHQGILIPPNLILLNLFKLVRTAAVQISTNGDISENEEVQVYISSDCLYMQVYLKQRKYVSTSFLAMASDTMAMPSPIEAEETV